MIASIASNHNEREGECQDKKCCKVLFACVSLVVMLELFLSLDLHRILGGCKVMDLHLEKSIVILSHETSLLDVDCCFWMWGDWGYVWTRISKPKINANLLHNRMG